MNTYDPWDNLNHQEATKLIASWLRNHQPGLYQYGYEIYLPSLAMKFLEQYPQLTMPDERKKIFKKHSSLFYSAAWDLCRRGVLRPGVTEFEHQATSDGAAGNGYSITYFGKQWLSEKDNEDFVPTEPEAFGKYIGQFKEVFGSAFHECAQQAIRCYNSHSYLACCTMCGAAAEAMVLKAASLKEGNEENVVKMYSGKEGRKKLEKFLFSDQKAHREPIALYHSLLNYWKSETPNTKSEVSSIEAFTTLSMLLRLAQHLAEKKS